MIPLSSTDREFLKRFAAVVASLHLIAAFLLVLAFVLYLRHPPPTAPNAQEIARERIAPVGAVYSGETGRAAAAAAAQAQAQAQAAASGQAYGGTTDGKTIFDNLCQACHAAGVAGAPKVGDVGAWKPRIAQGEATLLDHATKGFQGKTGVMPPKGGNPALTDEQVKAAVEWMTAQVK
jgi:cytochrome c5